MNLKFFHQSYRYDYSVFHFFEETTANLTMGNCFVTKIGPPKCKHEFLNEHNDRYFDRVQARNSSQPSHKRWPWSCRATKLEDFSEEWPSSRPPPTSLATESTSSRLLSLARSSPTSTIPEEEFEDLPFSTPWKSPLVSATYGGAEKVPLSPRSGLSSPSSATSGYRQRPPPRIQTDAATDGWQVKRKGHALRMRLAKNRFLQLAASGDATSPSATAGLSPITLDSGIQSQAKTNQEWNNDFETAGMVWVEITRSVPVTALAFSRSHSAATIHGGTVSLSTQVTTLSRPLLMAVGDEQGMVTVTEIVDEHKLPLSQSSKGEKVAPSAAPRKFGETLEFPMQGRIRSIDFSPDDRYLIVGGDGCVAAILLVVLDPQSNELKDLRILQQVERVDRIYSVQFHPQGSQLSIAGFDGKVAIGSIEGILSSPTTCKMREISRFGLIYCLDWSPTGNHVAVGGSDKICALYHGNGSLVHEVLRSTAIQALKWNHDGSFLAVGDRGVAILDGHDFHVKCEISNAPDDSPSSPTSKYRIEALCWSPDGTFLAIGGSDGICLVCETKGWALVHEVHRPSRIFGLAWGQRISNQEIGRYLAISDQDCSVALVKAGVEADGSEVDEASSAASSSYFSTASDWVLREDCFRDVDDVSNAVELPRDIKPQGNITALAFSRSSKSKGSSYVAFTADDCSLTIMTTRDWKAVFQMEFAKPLRTLAFSHSSHFLALGGDEGVLYVLSVPSRSIIFNTIFNATITTVAFSRHDERLAVGSRDGVLTLLCPDADWEPVGELDFSESPILAQDWSSKTLAVGREDGSVGIFDTEKAFSNFFVPLAEFSHSRPVRTLAFGSGGHMLAIGGDSGVLSILSSSSGWVPSHQVKVGGKASILSTKWSPAGRYLVIGGSCQTCRILDTITWMDVSDIPHSRVFQDSTAVSSVDWSVDGKWVALGSAGGGIQVLGTEGWQLLVPSKDRLKLCSQEDSDKTSTPAKR